MKFCRSTGWEDAVVSYLQIWFFLQISNKKMFWPKSSTLLIDAYYDEMKISCHLTSLPRWHLTKKFWRFATLQKNGKNYFTQQMCPIENPLRIYLICIIWPDFWCKSTFCSISVLPTKGAFLQGVQDLNLPKEMAIIPSILVQIEKLLCHNLFLIRTIFSSH